MNSIKEASSYSVDLRQTLSQNGNPPTVTLGKWYWLATGDIRMEDGHGRTLIMSRNRPGLMLDSTNRFYQDFPARQGLDSPFMLLEKIGEQIEEATKTLGTKSVAGARCQGIEIDLSKVWPEYAFADNKSVPDDKMLADPMYKRIQDSAAGWHFINQIRRDNPEASFNGLPVGPEDKNKVLFRWKLEDGSYQSIYGDLRTERTKPR